MICMFKIIYYCDPMNLKTFEMCLYCVRRYIKEIRIIDWCQFVIIGGKVISVEYVTLLINI